MTNAERELTVGIDIGSSALKALAVDGDGNVLASRRLRHRLGVRLSNTMEHDAVRAWRRAPRRAFDEIVSEVGSLGTVVGACVAGMVPSLTGVDGRGMPRLPGLLYGDDRGAPRSTRAHGATGTPVPLDGDFPTGRAGDLLRYCARELPGAHGFWPAQAVANFALIGRAVVDTSTALSMTPLFDGRDWCEAEVRGAGADPAQLPSVRPLGERAGQRSGVALASGIVDTLAEQIVSGAVADGDVLVICGTTLVVWCVASTWQEVPGLWTVPHTCPGKVLVGGASNAGGLFLDWARSLTSAEGGRLEPEHVPVWAPYPRGERTPFHDARRRAMLVDLELSDGRRAVRRAAVEAIGFVVRQHIDLSGVSARRIVATGGGAHDEEWMQALADATGLAVDVAAVPEGGALGAAFVARISAGLDDSLQGGARWAASSRRVEPDPQWARHAAVRYELFRQISARPPFTRREDAKSENLPGRFSPVPPGG